MVKKIFVFGSNLKGIHGAVAALAAKEKWAAVLGVGEGLTGNAYALPTKKSPSQGMSLQEIAVRVKTFIETADDFYEHHGRGVEFLVTQIGCGLAGYTPKEIAPMFIYAPPNCRFEQAWVDQLGPYGNWKLFKNKY